MTKISLSVFVCDLQVIVTTPMEMLKIQLQDAGRIGEGYNTIQYNTTQLYCQARISLLLPGLPMVYNSGVDYVHKN